LCSIRPFLLDTVSSRADTVGMPTGAEQLKDWMERRWPLSTRKARETAEYFGFDETFISQLLRGARRPGLTNALHIERLSGIPVEAWVSEPLDESAETVSAKPANRRQDRA
jgi:transcriptional regulator with XRE-family HTH domain